MKTSIVFIIVAWLGFFGTALAECDYCLLTQGISPLETTRGIGLRFDERYTRLATLFNNGVKLDGGGALETHWTTQITAFYSVNPRLTLMCIVPISRRFEQGEEEIEEQLSNFLLSTTRSPGRASEVFHDEGAGGKSFGLSDITLIGRYQVLVKHTLTSSFITAVQGGVRVPTGRTNSTNDGGELLDAHLQPGTGATNFLLGVSTNYVRDRLGFVLNGTLGIATEGNVGDETYQFGNSLNYDGSVRLRLNNSLQSSTHVFAALGIAGEYREKERLGGVEIDGSGGNTMYLTPGIQLFLKSVLFEFSFWKAIHHDLYGSQLGEDFKTFAGMTFLLR